MKKGIYFILFTLLFVCTIAQGQMDSLIQNIHSNTDANKSRQNISQLIDYCKSDSKCYLKFANEIDKLPFNEEVLKCYLQINGHLSKDNIDGVNDISYLAISKIKKHFPNDKRLGHFYNSLALYFIFHNKLDSALYYANKSELEYKKYDLQDVMHRPDFNRYLIYVALKDYKRADEYLWKSYSYVKDSPNRMNKGFLLHSILIALKERGEKKQFNKYFEEYIKFKKAGSTPTDIHHMALDAYFSNPEQAKTELEKVLKKLEKDSISLTKKDLKGIMLSEIYANEGNLLKSDSILNMIISDKNTIVQTKKDALYQQYLTNKKSKNYTQAFKSIDAFIHLQDSSNLQILNSKIADYEVKYQTQLKENELTKQKAIVAEDKLKLRTSYGLLFGLSALSFLLFIFYRNRIKHQKIMSAKEQEIQSQKIKHLEQENKVLALNSMIEGQLRIAQDLHDGLGGLLTTVKAHFSAIEREINAVKSLNIYDKTNDLIDKACIEVRRIAHNMVPHSIQISGLTGAMIDLKQSIESRGLICDLDIHGIETLDINQQKSSMIYRIIQEATNNVIKHANATSVFIQLLKNENTLHIIVEDNGKGFDINQVVNNKGMGLKSIDSRIKYLNGILHYDSSPNHGTTVNIEVPI